MGDLAQRDTAWVERGPGSGFVVGAVRGSIAGAVAFLIFPLAWASPLLVAAIVFATPPLACIRVEWREHRTIAPLFTRRLALGWTIAGVLLAAWVYLLGETLKDVERAVWIGGFAVAALTGACVAGCDAASARATTERGRLLARALTGPVTAVTLSVAAVSIEGFRVGVSPLYGAVALFKIAPPHATFAAVVVTLGLSLAALGAGRAYPGASYEARARRGARSSAILGGAIAIAMVALLEAPSILVIPLTITWWALAFVATALYAVGMRVARPVSLRVSRILEPGHAWLDRRERARVHASYVAVAKGFATKDAKKAIDAARRAFELCMEDPFLAPSRRADALRLAELLLEAERFDEVLALPKELAERPVLLAEVHRLKREPETAIAVLRGLEEGASPVLRASIHAIRALAEADLGQHGRAEAELAGLRFASLDHGPLLASHGFARVEGYLEFKRLTAPEPK